MPAVSEERMAELLAPYLVKPAPDTRATVAEASSLYAKLTVYLDLLLSWNARTNLTAIRSPEEIVRRHFGESLTAGLVLAGKINDSAAVLDFGSGAGFPGLPVQLLLPRVQVTLAESQSKKAAFLREAARALEVPVTIWAKRVEDMGAEQRFAVVMLRAVDQMPRMLAVAQERIQADGYLLIMDSTHPVAAEEAYRLPGLEGGWVRLRRLDS